MWSSSSGSLSVSWDMKVSPVVSVPRGEDAVLSCSFTHPRQQDYSGLITVKWIARETNALPFFKCSVRNDSMEELKDCPGSELKHSLRGDPRQGDLSLVIRKVHVADSGPYFCRVELDGWRQNQQGETRLRVTGKICLTDQSSGPQPLDLLWVHVLFHVKEVNQILSDVAATFSSCSSLIWFYETNKWNSVWPILVL